MEPKPKDTCVRASCTLLFKEGQFFFLFLFLFFFFFFFAFDCSCNRPIVNVAPKQEFCPTLTSDEKNPPRVQLVAPKLGQPAAPRCVVSADGCLVTLVRRVTRALCRRQDQEPAIVGVGVVGVVGVATTTTLPVIAGPTEW
jgi:hypothetical protein